jgi:tetratricopeptide (TPR) repeat protein
VLTVLTETAGRWDHVARDYLQPTVEQQPHLLLWAGGGTIARLAGIPSLGSALPAVGRVLDSVIGSGRHLDLDIGAVAVSEQLVHQARQDTDIPALAAELITFGVRLASVGRRAEALITAQQAVTLHQELAALNRDVYLPNLAASVHNLAVDLAEAGRRAEALTTAQQAVTLHRKLAAQSPDLFGTRLQTAEELATYLRDGNSESG